MTDLRKLLETIQSDYNSWVHKVVSDGDEAVSKKVFDGYSGSVQRFFKESKGKGNGVINPSNDERYKRFFSPEPRTIAVSYVWSVTTLFRIAGE